MANWPVVATHKGVEIEMMGAGGFHYDGCGPTCSIEHGSPTYIGRVGGRDMFSKSLRGIKSMISRQLQK